MNTNLNISDINKEKINNSHDQILGYTKIKRKLPKTPEIQAINTKKSYKKNTLNSQKRKISTFSLEHNFYFQPLTLTKEENQNDCYEVLYKKYLIIISKYEQIISELSTINKKLESNNGKLEELKENLKKLKEEKKQKQIDIVDLLSNKESLEEIYKNKVNYLVKSKYLKSNRKISNNEEIDDIAHIITENESFRIDEEIELEIKIDEIKNSDKKKFIEQVINFAEEILKNNEDEFNNKLKEKINLAYKVFYNEINSCSLNVESIVSNFFSRIGVFISNHSLGNFSELIINKFLRYLLKINSISIEIFQVIKFLNKKYKEYKSEIKENINNYIKKNENLIGKKMNLEKRREELEIKIEQKKENLKKIEQNKENKEFENNTNINITANSLYSIENFNNLKKRYLFKEKRKDKIYNPKNENSFNNFKEINNKTEINNDKNILKNQNKENNENSKYIIDKNKILNRKLNIKGKEINALKNYKINNNEVNDLDNENQKKPKINDLTEIDNSNNNNINSKNSLNQFNSNLNKNIQEIGKNNTINVNNLVINNDIKIKNINELAKTSKGDNSFDGNNIKDKNEIKKNNNTIIYYSKKKIEKINKNNTDLNNTSYNNNNNTYKSIINNINNNDISKKEIFAMNSNKTNNLDNTNQNNSFNIIKKPQFNKNIYIINNINNSDNICGGAPFPKVNNYKTNQKIDKNIGDYITFNNNPFEKNKKDLNNKNTNIDNNNKTINNATKEEKCNQSYNFHDILNAKTKKKISNNKILNNLNFDNIKFIPIKKINNSKLKNNSNSPPLNIQSNKNNKIILRKNNNLGLKNHNNTSDGKNINKVRKKLIDNNINNQDNNNVKKNTNKENNDKIPASNLNNNTKQIIKK